MTAEDPTLIRVLDKLDHFLTDDFPEYRIENERRLTRIETTVSGIQARSAEQDSRLQRLEKSCSKISDSNIQNPGLSYPPKLGGLIKAAMPYVGAILLGAAAVGALLWNVIGLDKGD